LPLLLALLQLLQLLLKLLRVAPQHFLLPALLKGLAVGALLIGEILLATGESVELAEGFVDGLLALAGG
jgi:hypothetical protein